MDFEPSQDQRAILDAVDGLLARHAGPARAIALDAKCELDAPLESALEDAGFLELATGEGTGPLDAALVVEATARAGGVASVAARALVAPALGEEGLPGPVALADAARPGPVRFAAQARSLLVCDGPEARCVALEPGAAPPVASNFGFPLGRVDAEAMRGGRDLGPASGERLVAWWRVAVACESVGAMDGALACTVDYLKHRRQFGRAIGSFQAVQQRLARCRIALEGSRWLAREAAYLGAPAEAAATAAAYGLEAAAQVFRETHQLSGAIGFTREHDLHVWSMRLKALEIELGGIAAQRRAVADARWPSARGAGP